MLKSHAGNVVIFGVLPPMKYEGVDSSRCSRGDWQPDARREAVFDVENLTLTASGDVALAHGFIRCDGTRQDGSALQEVARATFRLKKADGRWVIEHQHVSKPYEHW